MNNKSHSPVTEMLSGKYKIWLMVALGIMLLSDCMACGLLWARDAEVGYWIVPFLAAAMDLLYLAGVALSNQRFKYARSMFVVYIIISINLCLIWLLSAYVRDSIVFDNTAIIAWAVLHVAGIVSAVVTFLYAAKRIRGGRNIQFVLAIAVSCAALACCVNYAVALFSGGYFGQGIQNRPLTYSYMADGTCEVTGVVSGKGNSVTVPYEFNGRKVTAVSANVLTDGISYVTLKCDNQAELFEDISDLNLPFNRNVVINVEKENVDKVKSALYENYKTFELGNRVYPIVKNDELYVTYDYDRLAYNCAEGKIIPTSYCKKGDVFDLSKATDLEYVQKSNINLDDDLYWNYNNCGGYIMSELMNFETPLDGAKLVGSCRNIPVRFQKIYKVYPCASNDAMYKTSDYFNYGTHDGVELDYKLTVADKADELLESFDRGDGFTRTMRYLGQDYTQVFTSLSTFLKLENKDVVPIAPYWELVQPTVTIRPTGGSTDVVYGDSFSLTAEVSHPCDLEIEYCWYDSTQMISNDKTLSVNSARFVGKSEYTIVVNVSAPSVTDCESGNAANIFMNGTRRPLKIVWSEPLGGDLMGELTVNPTYDGESKYITATVENAVEGDYLYVMGEHVVDAGTYTTTAVLYGGNQDKYYISEGGTYTYTIFPCPVTLEWDEVDEFTYNGEIQHPTAECKGVDGNPLKIVYTNGQINFGDYSVRAQIKDKNYTVTNSEYHAFRINAREVDVIWSNTELTYSRNDQTPTAEIIGVKGERITLNVTGGKTNANINGETYTATALAPNTNYKLNPATNTTEFTIVPFEVKVTWTSTGLTYNGNAQAPLPSVLGAFSERIPYEVTGQATDVGTDYVAHVALSSNPVYNYRRNYVIVSGESQKFSISPRQVMIAWSNRSLTYNGSNQLPTASAKDVNNNDLELLVVGAQKNAGSGYTATAVFASPNPNYVLYNPETVFEINKRKVTVIWESDTLTYNGVDQAPTCTILGGVGQVAYHIDGKKTNVGKNYIATVVLDDDNYEIEKGETCTFSIVPAPEQQAEVKA